MVTDALPVIGVCAYLEIDGSGKCKTARLAVGGLATGVRRAGRGEQALMGKAAGDKDGIATAADAAAAEIDTQGDQWADAEYRKVLIAAVTREVVATAFARAEGRT